MKIGVLLKFLFGPVFVNNKQLAQIKVFVVRIRRNVCRIVLLLVQADE